MKKIILILGLVFLISAAFAHGEEENIREPSDFDAINPLYYFSIGNYGGAVFMSLIWFGILKGGYELTMLILARAL